MRYNVKGICYWIALLNKYFRLGKNEMTFYLWLVSDTEWFLPNKEHHFLFKFSCMVRQEEIGIITFCDITLLIFWNLD